METRAIERLAAYAAEMESTLPRLAARALVMGDSCQHVTLNNAEGLPVATLSRPYRMGETGRAAGLFRLSAIDGQPVAVFAASPTMGRVVKEIRAFVRAGAGLADMGAAELAEELADSLARETRNNELADSARFDIFRASAICRAIRAIRRADIARDMLAEAEAAPEACPCPDCGAADLARPEPGPLARAALAGAEAQGRAIVAEELARAFALRIKPVERPALGRAARALAELDSLGLDLLNPDWRDVLDSSLGFGPAARDVLRLPA